MRRLRFLLAATFFVAPAIAGCDSGLKEGISPEASTASPQPDALKNEMRKNADKMRATGKPKMAPSPPAEKPK